LLCLAHDCIALGIANDLLDLLITRYSRRGGRTAQTSDTVRRLIQRAVKTEYIVELHLRLGIPYGA